jgi:hypothetical protein
MYVLQNAKVIFQWNLKPCVIQLFHLFRYVVEVTNDMHIITIDRLKCRRHIRLYFTQILLNIFIELSIQAVVAIRLYCLCSA